MTSVCVIHHRGYRDTSYEKEVEDIIRINPDKIVCLSFEEVGMDPGKPHFIFRKFFDRIRPWLRQNNKTINLVCPHSSGEFIEFNVITERCTSLILEMGSFMYTRAVGPFDCLLAPGKSLVLFTCYNNNARLERAMMVDALAKNNLLPRGMVTYHFPDRVVIPPEDSGAATPFDWKYHDGSVLKDEDDFILNSTKPTSAQEFPQGYISGLFDVVCESRYREGEFFLTEKTLKPIAAHKPFLALSCKGYHADLRDFYGFRLYENMFDYSFDSCDSIDDRIAGIIENMNRIASYGNDKRMDLYKGCIPNLVYNKYKIGEIYYNPQMMVPASLKFLMDGGDHQVYEFGDGYYSILSLMREMKWI